MNALDLIGHLEREGVRLWEDRGDLRFRAPHGVMTPERRAVLHRQKEDVIAWLRRRAGMPVLVADPKARHEPFPLTDLQAAYLVGRGNAFPYGRTGCHGYAELVFSELEGRKLAAAWNRIIRRHDMLRAVVDADGFQRILPEVPAYSIPVQDFRGLDEVETEVRIGRIRAQMDHRVYDPAVWPLFDLRVTLRDQGALLHFSIDLLMVDLTSTRILLDELQRAYFENDDLGEPAPNFRDYSVALQGLRDSAAYGRDREYWLSRIEDLPSRPEPPIMEHHGSGAARFERHQFRLDERQWATLSDRAKSRNLTVLAVALAAFAEIIGRWSAQSRFTLNLPLQNRLEIHPDIDKVVGEFTSVELLAVDLDHGTPFVERVRRLQSRLWQDLDHQLFSGSEVIREISRRRGSGDALFPVVFTGSLDAKSAPANKADAFDRLRYGITQTPQAWIDCQIIATHGGAVVNCDARQEVLLPGVVEAMVAAFEKLLTRLAGDETVWDETDPLDIPLSEQRLAANATEGPVPDRLLHENFVEQALRRPERVALIVDERVLTYGDLLQRAQGVSDFLRSQGIRPGDLVGVMLTNRSNQIVAVLGILMAGCAYVPIEPDHPLSRRAHVATACGIQSIFCEHCHQSDAHRFSASRLIPLDALAPAATVSEPRQTTRDINRPAYVIHTSGSTGAPKGVIVSHLSAANTVTDINRRFAIGERDRVFALSSLGFDLSVYDIFGPLSVGACIVAPDHSRRADPSHWARLIACHGVTVWNSVPMQLQMLHDYLRTEKLEGLLSSLRLGLLSGDWIPVALPNHSRELMPNFQLISLGGATEAAIWSIHHPIDVVSAAWHSIPYGRPLTNQTIHVLDSAMRPCPDWVKGEILIGGLGLAIGYLGDEQKTAERFVRDPGTGERLYRTGDAGRYMSDGSIELLGRLDRQVKIRGHRVELAEIEVTLRSHQLIENAAVIAPGAQPTERRLIAFATAKKLADAAPMTVAIGDLQRCGIEAGADLQAAAEKPHYAEYVAKLDRAALLTMQFAIGQYDQHRAGGGAAAERPPWMVRRCRQILHDRPLPNGVGTQEPRELGRGQIVEAWQRVRELAAGVEAPAIAEALRDRAIEFVDKLCNARHGPSPPPQFDVLEAISRETLLAKLARRVAAGALRRIATDTPHTLRVLEFGAAAPVTLEESDFLAGLDLEIVVTDPSAAVLQRAAERQAGRAVRFAVYRSDLDYRLQGFEANSFDVIITCNMLHRTSNINESLCAIRELIVPGGWLLAAEATRDNPAIMLSLEPGLRLDGDGEAFRDARRGCDKTCLLENEWTELFAGIGARPIIAFAHEETPLARFGMQVFAACLKRDRIKLDPSEIRQFLARQLPEPMVPAKIYVVDALPVTANAKIDNKQLEAWIQEREVFAPVINPVAASDLERRIAMLWADVLKIDEVAPDQCFLRLGGDSLTAAKLAGRMRESLPEARSLHFDELLRKILEDRTIREIAEALVAGEDISQPSGVSTFAVERIEGSGPAIRALVQDAAGRLGGCEPLVARLSDSGTVLGLVVSDIGSYLQIDPASLVARAAQCYVDGLIDGGFLRLDVIGCAGGAEFAVEVARQLLEAGAIVDKLMIVDGPSPENAAAPTIELDRVREHSRHGFESYAPSAYAGDITIAGLRGPTDAVEQLAERWRAITLGDVDIVFGGPDIIVATLLEQQVRRVVEPPTLAGVSHENI